jgi:serine/threonine-protein kinase RsbW
MSAGWHEFERPGIAKHPSRTADWCKGSVASTAGMGQVVDAVLGAMAAKGYPSKDLFGARLALEEAIVNAIKHGHRQDPSKRVSVRYRVHAEQVLVVGGGGGPRGRV